MATNYTGNVTPSLSNAPANAWTDDATKASHVGNTYLVTGSGGTAGNVYSFEEYAAPVIKSATGLPADIVTITDGGDSKNALKATVSLSPIQSLNGYDHPWAGGAGKNKFDFATFYDAAVKQRCTATQAADEKITVTATTTGAMWLGVSQAIGQSVPSGCFRIKASQGDTFITTVPSGQATGYFELDSNGVVLVAALSITGAYTVTNASCAALAFRLNWGTASAVGDTVSGYVQIEKGATRTTWEPYENICPITGHAGATLKIGAEYPTADREYTSSFGQTVYGGTFDFVSGKLTVTHASKLGSELSWNFGTTSHIGYCFITGKKTGRANITASAYKTVDKYYTAMLNGEISGSTSDNGVNVKETSCSSLAEFQTAIANVQFVYELATPIEIDLTPAQVQTLLGLNNVWASDGQITQFQYRSNQFQPEYNWFENWTMPKITRNNGNITVLPYPQEYTPEIYDVDAATTGRNAAGTMIRDRVARKHKFNYKFPPLSQADATEILAAVQDTSFTLTTASPETGAKTNYTVYVGDRSLPVYWMPNHDNASWLYSSLSLNLIEM